ncbi:hypothetical protein ACGLWX_12165 [Halomonas sp. HMF6819]|uniref:hypothetical protein n=1 Tax=Halomonas sp. HMF6819 TaxID=3373085 RepID=UPI00379621C8
MMPVAIMRDMRTHVIRFHFTDPDCLLTAEQAIACGLINDEEREQLEQEAKAFGKETTL